MLAIAFAWRVTPLEGRTLAGVVAVLGGLILLYMLTRPALLRRRLRGGMFGEVEASQRVIITLLYVAIAAVILLTAIDMRNDWSSVPWGVTLVGDILVGAGLLLILLVFIANQYAGASVRVEAGQTVTSTGVYALVRHPMYSGMLLAFLGLPLALGSWWGLAPYPLMVAVFVWRLLDEERYLTANLPGYADYLQRVRYRLIPRVW